MASLLGGSVEQLSRSDVLSRGGMMGNVYGPRGGFRDSPLYGSLVGKNQTNSVNIARNDQVDPLNSVPSVADVSLATAVQPNDKVVISVAISVAADIGGGDGTASGTGTGSGPGAGGPGAGAGPGSGAAGASGGAPGSGDSGGGSAGSGGTGAGASSGD